MVHVSSQEGFLPKWKNPPLHKNDQHDHHRNQKCCDQGIAGADQTFLFHSLPAQTLFRTFFLTGEMPGGFVSHLHR